MKLDPGRGASMVPTTSPCELIAKAEVAPPGKADSNSNAATESGSQRIARAFAENDCLDPPIAIPELLIANATTYVIVLVPRIPSSVALPAAFQRTARKPTDVPMASNFVA